MPPTTQIPRAISINTLVARLAPWLLLSAVFLVYSGTFSVPLLLDDYETIQENPTLSPVWRAFLPPSDSGSTVSGRPILNLSFALSSLLTPGSVAGHHLINILIHGVNACLVYTLVLGTLRLPSRRFTLETPSLVALAIALLWSLHPLQTAAVTYLSQRAEVLVSFFFLSTLVLFLQSRLRPGKASLFLTAAVFTATFGMASKEVMALAPFIVLLYDRTFVSGKLSTAWNQNKLFYTALFSTWAILLICVLHSGFRGNTAGLQTGTNWLHYLYTQAFALTHYLRLTIWPDPLIFDYGRELANTFEQIAWRAVLVLTAATWILARVLHNKAAGFLGASFLAVLAPTTLVPIATQTIAEHRVYLALAPLIAGMVVFAILRLNEKTTILFSFIVSAVLGFITIDRNRDYLSEEAIWADTIAKRPGNDRAWYAMGYVRIDQDRYEDAKNSFREAVRLRSDPINIMGYAHALTAAGEADEAIPLYRQTLDSLPRRFSGVYESMSNLGKLLGEKGYHEEALELLRDAITLNPRKTGAYYNLGALCFSLGLYEEAAAALPQALSDTQQNDEAISLLVRSLLALGRANDALAEIEKYRLSNPQTPAARLAYARALAGAGKIQNALSEYHSLLREHPNFPSVHTQLGILYLAIHRPQEAHHHLSVAIAQDPQDAPAHSALAEILLKSNNLQEAVKHLKSVAHLTPTDHKTRYLLANGLLQLGQLEEAAKHYEQLIANGAGPLPDVHNELGIVYAQLGEVAKARRHFLECLRLAPGHPRVGDNLRLLDQP